MTDFSTKQECIPVGYVPPAFRVVLGGLPPPLDTDHPVRRPPPWMQTPTPQCRPPGSRPLPGHVTCDAC